jgi:hypothetical protein
MLANNFNLVIQLVHGIKAARNLHSNLLKSVLGAPMRFFETVFAILTKSNLRPPSAESSIVSPRISTDVICKSWL